MFFFPLFFLFFSATSRALTWRRAIFLTLRPATQNTKAVLFFALFHRLFLLILLIYCFHAPLFLFAPLNHVSTYKVYAWGSYQVQCYEGCCGSAGGLSALAPALRGKEGADTTSQTKKNK
uniref:Uncharacterized protein n=1 Tax=Trypanosoma vivax (strain Y486) TaxID=1055687 RepID=G0U1P2_TRYVY|nr:hypothetical protein TVY486_0806060 [Trypanosoma vivax Y486]